MLVCNPTTDAVPLQENLWQSNSASLVYSTAGGFKIMNEQRNTALIQKLYEAFGRGDIQLILDNLTDDVEWTLEGPAIIPYAGKKSGPAEVKDFFTALGSTQVNMKLTTAEFIAQGDRVTTLGRFGATVKATGKKFDSPVAHFFTIRNGKVSRFVDVGDTAAIAEAYRANTASAAL
jgi:ketosteroid isomerase-like protein